MGPWFPKLLAYLVILCFDKRRHKQKYCCSPKIKHLPLPKHLGWLHHWQLGLKVCFSIYQVTSNMGADGDGRVSTYSGNVSDAGWRVTYKANHVYGADDPSCAQVLFYMVS